VVVVIRTVSLGDRGRVPFALVGVLLVVTSALFAAAVQPPSRPPEPAVDVAMERTTADARSTLREAVASASVAAASEPVVTAANTTYGRLLDENEPFRDALRIRVYLLARERFASVSRSHRGVRTNVSLPATPTPEALARAKERVTVERAGPDGTELDVTVRNVTQTARYGGRTVARRNVTLSVRVDSPVLAVHDRVTEFQERLDADLDEPGLSRLVTARLYGAAWARGYAQYYGAPIENVVVNRHVGLVTNGGVLTLQRRVFGEADPDGRRAHTEALAALAITEMMSTVTAPEFAATNGLLQEQVRQAAAPTEDDGIRQPGADAPNPEPSETMEVTVGETAVNAFAPYTRDERATPLEPFGTGAQTDWITQLALSEAPGLNETIQRVFSASLRTVGESSRESGGEPAPPAPPDSGGGWRLLGGSTDTTVTGVEDAPDGPTVRTPEGYHRFYDVERVVTLRHERKRTWQRGQTVRRTRTQRTERRRVRVALVGRHAPVEHAPDNPVETVHEPAGPFDGQNLADIEEAGNETVVEARGGVDALAAAAARGHLDEGSTTVEGSWPSDLREWAYTDLVELREEVRDISTLVQRGRLGTFEVSPPARLLEEIQSHRADLVEAPDTYDHVADRARVELRAQYFERVVALLEARIALREQQESSLASTLGDHTPGSLSRLRSSLAARRVDGTDDSGNLELTVDGAPPYLVLTGLDSEDLSVVEEGTTVHPLAARNVNVATIPFADATDTVLNGVGEALSGEPRVDLRTAVDTLEAVEAAENATGNESLAADRSRLRRELNDSVSHARIGVGATLAAHDVGDRETRREIVDSAFGRWETTRARALAVANRTVVDAVVATTAAREGTNLTAMELDMLRLDLQDRLTRSLDTGGVAVSGEAVTAASHTAKAVVGQHVEGVVTSQVGQRFNRSLNRMPAGIPLLPPFSAWYATTNIWFVTVDGRYERFAVETPRRTPSPEDASLSYVRDGSKITLDVDGDGSDDHLGNATRIDFRLNTAVVVVVPPGGAGVGDINGDMDERSPGWPLAGPESLTPPDDDENETAPGDGVGSP